MMDSFANVRRDVPISSSNHFGGLEPTEIPLDINEDELIELELSQLEEPVEQPIEVSDERNGTNSPKKMNFTPTTITRFLSLITNYFIELATSIHMYKNKDD